MRYVSVDQVVVPGAVMFNGEAYEVQIIRRGCQIGIVLQGDAPDMRVIATKFVDPADPVYCGFRERLEDGALLVFVKDYAENAGMVDALIEYNIALHAGVGMAPVTVPAGYAELYVMWLNPILVD